MAGMTAVPARSDEAVAGTFSGTYPPEDVEILLTPASVPLVGVVEKERLIQSGGRHYSEMLSPERVPDARYLAHYDEALDRNAGRLRADAEALAEMIGSGREAGSEAVIVSLARAGTPIGVLVKRALSRLGFAASHYSVSIVRDRGIDLNALRHVADRHDASRVVFLDGWTGKGAIRKELDRSLADRPFGFEPRLAVVADPAGCADIAATGEDYLIPSGLLNGIVSGLISRSVLNADLVGPDDFHACAFQDWLLPHDRTMDFIARVERARPEPRTSPWSIRDRARLARARSALMTELSADCGVGDPNLVKPGIAEATRAVMRRTPARVLLGDPKDPDVLHLVHLAQEAGVPVEARNLRNYRAVTIIRSLKGSQE